MKKMPTSLDEFNKWLSLLPWEPWLIPIQQHSKNPDVPKGESWKNAKYRLTIEEAKKRIEDGLNVGVVATGQDFVFFDFDNPEKFMLEKGTLTVQTRNGKIHKYFLNGGEVKNADGKELYKGCGEVRAEWKYVLTPGSYVPPDDKAESGATGLYMVTVEMSPATLYTEDLPLEFRPAYIETDSKEKPPAVMAGSFRNQYGWSIEDVCKRDGKLDGLLRSQTLTYPSQSEADMACLSKLLFWGYTEGEAVDILKYFRGRPKLDRKDYVEMTLSKVSHGETIANYVDVSRWNPSTGYGLPFETQGSNYEADEHKVGLIFKVVSKREVKVKAVSGGKSVTGWVTVQSPEKLRTSRNAKVLRDLLKTAYPKDWRAVLENTIGRVEKAVANWKPKMEEPNQDREEKPRFSEDVQSSIEVEVAKIVNAENQLEALRPHLDNVIVKEEDNKKAISILLAGSKFSDVAKKQIILLKGTEGGGKSTLARELCRIYRVKEVGRFSAHALDYSNLEGFDVLLLKELGAMDMEKQGVSTLKFLSSDDRGYTVEITVKDEETGRFTTEQHRIPCMTVVSTTTRLILDSQFERRAWLFNVDETKEQTKEVALWKAKRKRQQAEKLLGLREIRDYEFSREVLKRFVEQLTPEKIIIPFPETLTEVLGYDVLRVRGDLDKIYAFVELYGLFNLKRLQKLKGDVYALTPEVCIEALQIVMKPLANMISRMDDRTTQILATLKELEISNSQDAITKSDREKIAVHLGKSENTVLKFLNFLEHSGFLSGDGKKPKTHTLLYSIEKIEVNLAGISGKLESPDVLMDKMVEEAQDMLKTVSCNKILRDTYLIKENTMPQKNDLGKPNIEFYSMVKNTNKSPFHRKTMHDPDLSVNHTPLTKTTLENRGNKKRPILQKEKEKQPSLIRKREGNKITTKTKEPMFICPICEKHGKPIFFVSEQDLKLHIQRLHTGYPDYVR